MPEKEEFMESCLKDHSKEECEEMWEEKQKGDKASDYGSVTKECEMLKNRVRQLEGQLRQAIDIAQRANQREEARDEAQKDQLVTSIMKDSKYAKESLVAKTLPELHIIRTAIDNALQKDFVSVAADLDPKNVSKKPKLSIGEWDPDKKKWVGGM